tara:strand:+ start:5554 stop:6609 length:1056 start_codon:yes stop_codon:yes gene_type:complete
MSKQAVLLVNLGSPDSTDVADVKRYLAEFLTDERVIDLPFVRKFVVPAIILNTRPKKSAEAYSTIWTEEGSPLVATSVKQQQLLQERSDCEIYLAMRYGDPSIPDILERMVKDGVDEVFLVPLYPQYAMSSYETVVVRVMEVVRERFPDLKVDTLQPFYKEADYLDVLAESARGYIDDSVEKLVISFHGIPERHVKLSDPSHSHCLLTKDCCHVANPAHATCYRHQCLFTAEALAERLGLPEDRWIMSFQSRLGRDPWLMPPSDATIRRLAAEGVKKIKVICPAFVTDCLETLEEIAEGVKEEFIDAGGESFEQIPCLNEHPGWIQFLHQRVQDWTKESAEQSSPERAPLA